jgi:glutamate N-acetyltransferase/amino-acid N-acetyltransferase
MEWIAGGVTTPQGFLAAAGRAGIKAEGDDIALVVSEVEAAVAGVFTTNVVKAAPVRWSRRIVNELGRARAVVLNSGNANACTGRQGEEDARTMAETVATGLSVPTEQVLVASTGVIGMRLPMQRVTSGIEQTVTRLSRGEEADRRAADAIRTTDTVIKQAAVRVSVGGYTLTIGGMAKGSGMIHPNMATMLAVLTTDAVIPSPVLQQALQDCVDQSFNMISVDGDTSTNDSVFLLANGCAGNSPLLPGTEGFRRFREALTLLATSLAKQIARDGEGATKLLEVHIQGAADVSAARRLAKSVVTSNLVKTALFGADANWGRVLAALGYSGVSFDPFGVSVAFASQGGRVTLVERGEPLAFSEAEAEAVLSADEVRIEVWLGEGSAEATAWGCDLSYDYVRINADYRT